MPGNYKKLEVSDTSSAPSDLAALVCLALRYACLKWYSADVVTESTNKQKFLLMVHPCGKPQKVSQVIWDSVIFQSATAFCLTLQDLCIVSLHSLGLSREPSFPGRE